MEVILGTRVSSTGVPFEKEKPKGDHGTSLQRETEPKQWLGTTCPLIYQTHIFNRRFSKIEIDTIAQRVDMMQHLFSTNLRMYETKKN